MKINTIRITAGRTFNHPYETYSNLRFDIDLQAVVEDGEDAIEKVKELQATAEKMAEEHKNALKNDIRALAEMARTQSEMNSLEAQLTRMQQRMDELRKHKEQFTGEGPKLLTIMEAEEEYNDDIPL